MKYHFYLKEILTNCAYLDLGIWQTFFQKWKKLVYHLKEKSLQVFVANDKNSNFQTKIRILENLIPEEMGHNFSMCFLFFF